MASEYILQRSPAFDLYGQHTRLGYSGLRWYIEPTSPRPFSSCAVGEPRQAPITDDHIREAAELLRRAKAELEKGVE